MLQQSCSQVGTGTTVRAVWASKKPVVTARGAMGPTLATWAVCNQGIYQSRTFFKKNSFFFFIV